MSPRLGTSSSQPRFTVWLHLGISKPSTSSTHLRLLYSSGRVPQAKQVGANLGLHHLGNPRAHTIRGQLQTTSEPHDPDPVRLILHGGRRLVVSGHSLSLQLTGLGKCPHHLTCQQQTRLNYKRRVYSAHTKGAPRVPSLGDRGGWTLQDICYIRPHYQDTESKQLYLLHRNKHREAAKIRRQTWPK